MESGRSVPTVVTTSWDDGDPHDLRIAELLRARDLPGTFYVPVIGYHGGPTLDAPALRDLAGRGFEIGAHGFTHHTLPKFRGKELTREVGVPKKRLEDIIGREVRMFSYPKGRFNARVVHALKQADYSGARTTRMLACNLDFEPFQMPTTLHAFPHSRFQYLKNLSRAGNLRRARDYVTRFSLIGNWVELAKRFFDHVFSEGGVWHLFGHSWEIEALGLWEDLAEVLNYACRRQGVLYVSNRELSRLVSGHDLLLEVPGLQYSKGC